MPNLGNANKTIIYFLILLVAILLSNTALNYVIIYIFIGFFVTILSNSRFTAVCFGILVTVVNYIIAYLNGFVINQALPSDIGIYASFYGMVSTAIYGLIIPVVVTIIICWLSSMLATRVMSLTDINLSSNREVHHFDNEESFNKNYNQEDDDYEHDYQQDQQENQQQQEDDEDDDEDSDVELVYDPIQKSIMKNNKK